MLKILLDIVTIIVVLCGVYFLTKYIFGKEFKSTDLFKDFSFEKLFYQNKGKSKKNKSKGKD